MPLTRMMLPFWIRPSAPASAWTWFCDHAATAYGVFGAGGVSARIDRHAGLAGGVDRRGLSDAVDGQQDDRVDALAHHLLDRRDLLLSRGCGHRRRDVGQQAALHESFALGDRELLLQAGQHVRVVGVGDRERDVADLPRGLGRDLGRRPWALDQLAREARVDRLQVGRHAGVDAARVRRDRPARCSARAARRGSAAARARRGDDDGDDEHAATTATVAAVPTNPIQVCLLRDVILFFRPFTRHSFVFPWFDWLIDARLALLAAPGAAALRSVTCGPAAAAAGRRRRWRPG